MKSVGLLYIFVVGYFSYPPLKDDIHSKQILPQCQQWKHSKNVKVCSKLTIKTLERRQ